MTKALEGFKALLFLAILLFRFLFWMLERSPQVVKKYWVWKANQLPQHILGAFGVVLVIISLAFQGVQPATDILNYRR